MFWLSLLAVSLAIVLIKLGAYSVWMSVLTFGLQAALLVVAVLAAVLIWKKFAVGKS